MNVAPVITESFDVRNRLAELGLEVEDLLLAANRGAAAGFECTENYPLQAAGFYRWSEATANVA